MNVSCFNFSTPTDADKGVTTPIAPGLSKGVTTPIAPGLSKGVTTPIAPGLSKGHTVPRSQKRKHCNSDIRENVALGAAAAEDDLLQVEKKTKNKVHHDGLQKHQLPKAVIKLEKLATVDNGSTTPKKRRRSGRNGRSPVRLPNGDPVTPGSANGSEASITGSANGSEAGGTDQLKKTKKDVTTECASPSRITPSRAAKKRKQS